MTAGPYKIMLADSGLPDLDGLTDRIRNAHEAGRAVAVHCVTREALVLLLAALESAGTTPGDRVEHAGVVPSELVPELARRGLRVVTQPGFIADRGDDFRRGVPAGEHADLYRCRSLLRGGVPVALSSEAPYGPIDPWAVIAAGAAGAPPAVPSSARTRPCPRGRRWPPTCPLPVPPAGRHGVCTPERRVASSSSTARSPPSSPSPPRPRSGRC
jgi:predicted amidohydrolase YtcJ